MPSRNDIFRNKAIYHVYDKTIDRKNVFHEEEFSKIFLSLLRYYRSTSASLRYSYLDRVSNELRQKLFEKINDRNTFQIEVLCYCLMPNHYHLLLKQKAENGIVNTLSKTLNSFTRFYNTKRDRKGPLFLPQFRSKKVTSDHMLTHVSRYIHLNPYSSKLINNFEKLTQSNKNSLKEYLGKSDICDTSLIMGYFNHDVDRYRKFVLGNAKHQRKLEQSKKHNSHSRGEIGEI